MSYDDPESTGPVVEYSWLKRVLKYSLEFIPNEKLSTVFRLGRLGLSCQVFIKSLGNNIEAKVLFLIGDMIILTTNFWRGARVVEWDSLENC